MGFWSEIGIGVRSLSIVWAVIIGVWLLKVTGIGAGKLVERLCLPAERRVFQWLQDRAAARALGMDIDIIRARRKIEGTDKPVDMRERRPAGY